MLARQVTLNGRTDPVLNFISMMTCVLKALSLKICPWLFRGFCFSLSPELKSRAAKVCHMRGFKASLFL